MPLSELKFNLSRQLCECCGIGAELAGLLGMQSQEGLMRITATGAGALDRVTRDGFAGVLTGRLALLVLVLTSSFVATLMLASVRELVVRTVATAFPVLQVEASSAAELSSDATSRR